MRTSRLLTWLSLLPAWPHVECQVRIGLRILRWHLQVQQGTHEAQLVLLLGALLYLQDVVV